jgi:hypothetical protein
MIKNLLLLIGLSYVSFTYAAHPIAKESMDDAQSYKIEKSVEENEAQRSVAGERIKKKRSHEVEVSPVESSEDQDSEVRYWKYQE